MNWITLAVAASFARYMVGSLYAGFSPVDNYMIACGSSKNITYHGRTFVPDSNQSSFLLKSSENFAITSFNNSAPPIYQSMRGFSAPASYQFDIRKRGRHWVRLYFYPVLDTGYDFESASITVVTEEFVLLNNFTFKNYSRSYLFREYVIEVDSNNLTITFIPMRESVTFVNGIEVVSVPDEVFSDEALTLTLSGPYRGLSDLALEVVHRLNVGGPSLTPQNDTLGRTWDNDNKYIHHDWNASLVTVAINPEDIRYRAPVTPQTAPNLVYATAVAIGDLNNSTWFFNISWVLPVDRSYRHFVRLHFCDIVSQALYDIAFSVFINSNEAIPILDLSTINGNLKVPYFKDFIIDNASDTVNVSLGPISSGGITNLTLNGLEIMKISNDARSLDGVLSAKALLVKPISKNRNKRKMIGLIVGASITVSVTLIGCCYFCLMALRSTAANQEPSWLATIASIFEFRNHDRIIQSKKINESISRLSFASSNLGRIFSLQEIRDATNGFEESLLLGVGGFGSVYMGSLEDGTKVAIKRANPKSRQGSCEFLTEIKILSGVRHRHLVSLLGCCDEQSEMILVYEFMENGTLRSHLYGTERPSLSWKQRLQICIGAARGLHYLHTGAAQTIIHRDVKTTNILLDENFVAKVSDFGLSKMGPGTEQTHVSTVVKGTFGYFDPEYIRKQQLTTKSDVYSFGVVLLEVLCARPVLLEVLPSEEVYIVDWAMTWQRKGKLDHIMDPTLVAKVNPASVKKFSETAEKCLSQHGADRPTIGNVLLSLECALQLDNSSFAIMESEGSSTSVFTDPEGSSTTYFES